MPEAKLYFDFISPFAYLYLERLRAAPLRIQIHYKPILFAAVLNERGQLGPAEIPEKRRFTYRFVQWRASQLGIALRFPDQHPFNPIALLRMAVLLGNDGPRLLALMRSVWRDGRLPEDEKAIDSLGKRLGIDDASARIAEPAIKQGLRANTEEALKAGLFGVPTMLVADQIFWGEDSLNMLGDFLDDPSLFDSPDMRRLDQLPVGARRQ